MRTDDHFELILHQNIHGEKANYSEFVRNFKISLDPEKFNAFRLKDPKEAKLLIRALIESMEALQ